MPHRIATYVAIALALLFGGSGCSYMTARGRGEMRYRHYVNHNIRQRQKQIAKVRKAHNRKLKQDWQAQPPVPSQPVVSSSVETGDQVSAPMTVSSSEAAQARESEPAP